MLLATIPDADVYNSGFMVLEWEIVSMLWIRTLSVDRDLEAKLTRFAGSSFPMIWKS